MYSYEELATLGRDNGTFLHDMATLDGKKRTGGKAAVGMDGPAPKRTKTKNQPAAKKQPAASLSASPAGSTPHHTSSEAVQTKTVWSAEPGDDLWTTRIRESLNEMMAKCDGCQISG